MARHIVNVNFDGTQLYADGDDIVAVRRHYVGWHKYTPGTITLLHQTYVCEPCTEGAVIPGIGFVYGGNRITCVGRDGRITVPETVAEVTPGMVYVGRMTDTPSCAWYSDGRSAAIAMPAEDAVVYGGRGQWCCYTQGGMIWWHNIISGECMDVGPYSDDTPPRVFVDTMRDRPSSTAIAYGWTVWTQDAGVLTDAVTAEDIWFNHAVYIVDCADGVWRFSDGKLEDVSAAFSDAEGVLFERVWRLPCGAGLSLGVSGRVSLLAD